MWRASYFILYIQVNNCIDDDKCEESMLRPPSEPSLLDLAQHPWLRDVGHVDEDIVGGVAVERGTETFLIEVVANETNRSAKDEETVEGTNLFNRDKYHSI